MKEYILTLREREKAFEEGTFRDFIKIKLEEAGFNMNKSITVKQRLEDSALIYGQK